MIQAKQFSDLSKEELYQILALRTEVFVVEQNCPYQELDGLDQRSIHMIGLVAGQVVATSRIIPIKPNHFKLGRFVVKKSHRGAGLGKKLVEETLLYLRMETGSAFVEISAQTYLIKFYEEFGFVKVGQPYLEDDIPHHKMTLSF